MNYNLYRIRIKKYYDVIGHHLIGSIIIITDKGNAMASRNIARGHMLLNPICVFGYKFTPDTCHGGLPPGRN